MKAIKARTTEMADTRIEMGFGIFDITATIDEDEDGLQWVSVRIENIDESRVSIHPSGDRIGIALGGRGTTGFDCTRTTDGAFEGKKNIEACDAFMDATGDVVTAYYYAR